MAAWVEWLLVVACGCLGQVVPRGCLCALVVRGCLPWIPQTIAYKCCPVVHMLSCAALYLEWTNMIGAQDTVGWLVCHHCPLSSSFSRFRFSLLWILSTSEPCGFFPLGGSVSSALFCAGVESFWSSCLCGSCSADLHLHCVCFLVVWKFGGLVVVVVSAVMFFCCVR